MRLSDFIVCTEVLDGGPSLGEAELVGRLLTLLAQAAHLPASELPEVQAAVLRREQPSPTAGPRHPRRGCVRPPADPGGCPGGRGLHGGRPPGAPAGPRAARERLLGPRPGAG